MSDLGAKVEDICLSEVQETEIGARAIKQKIPRERKE
jgi:hypothetical protein